MKIRHILIIVIGLLSLTIQSSFGTLEPSRGGTKKVIKPKENVNQTDINLRITEITNEEIPSTQSSLVAIEKNAKEEIFHYEKLSKKAAKFTQKSGKRLGIKGGGPDNDLKTDGFALTGMILGILGLLLFGIILGPLAIIFSGIGLLRILSGKSKGLGFAIAGLACGFVGIVGWIILVALYL